MNIVRSSWHVKSTHTNADDRPEARPAADCYVRHDRRMRSVQLADGDVLMKPRGLIIIATGFVVTIVAAVLALTSHGATAGIALAVAVLVAFYIGRLALILALGVALGRYRRIRRAGESAASPTWSGR